MPSLGARRLALLISIGLACLVVRANESLGGSTLPTPTPGRHRIVFGYESDLSEYLGQGKTEVVANANGSVTHDPGVVLVALDVGDWSLAFQAPRGSELMPGVYEDATNGGSPRKPAVDVSGEHRFCSFLKGRFVVREAAYAPDGDVQRFAVDFELHCENEDPIFFGYVRIDSDVPSPPRRTPTPTPGADNFSLYVGESPGGVPSGVGFSQLSLKMEYYLSPWAVFRPNLHLRVSDGDMFGAPTYQFGFASPVCRDLVPGEFHGATEIPFEALDAPGMVVTKDGHSYCAWSVGDFAIRDVQYGTDGEIYRLVIDFDQQCTGAAPVFGSIKYRSLRPTPTPAPPTPTPTDYSSTAAFSSQMGDFIGHCTSLYLTLSDGDFSAAHGDGTVIVTFEGGFNTWIFRFAAPAGEDLIPGTYTMNSRYPARPGMDVAGQGRGCNRVYGSFTVLEAEYGTEMEVTRFAADFEQHCEGPEVPPLSGTIRFHSSLPPPTPFATASPTPPPGQGPCWGDCSGDGVVAVNELILAVNILLGERPIGECASFDVNNNGRLTVGELIQAVNAFLLGCVAAPSP